MKILIVAILFVILSGCGATDSFINGIKGATGNLTRTVTVYTANGQVIKTYTTTNQIEYAGSVAGFIDVNGINVRVSGTFIIEGN